MSNIVLDRQWLRDPNLLIPQRKPTGLVQADRENDLTRGLLAAWLFQDDDYLYQRDSVGGYHGVFAGTVDASNYYMTKTALGNALHNTTDSKNTRLDIGTIAGSDPLSGYPTQQISVYSIYRRTISYNNGNPRLIEKGDGGSAANGWGFSLVSTGAITLYVDGVRTLVTRPEDTISKWYGLGFSAKPDGGNTNIRYFQDGAYFNGHTIASSFPNTSCNLALSNWNHTTDRSLNGELLCLYVWDRAIDDKEHEELHANPYGMFVSL